MPRKQTPQDFPEFFIFCFFVFFFPPNLLDTYYWGRIWATRAIHYYSFSIPFLFLSSCSYNLEENIIEVIIGYIRYINVRVVISMEGEDRAHSKKWFDDYF